MLPRGPEAPADTGKMHESCSGWRGGTQGPGKPEQIQGVILCGRLLDKDGFVGEWQEMRLEEQARARLLEAP